MVFGNLCLNSIDFHEIDTESIIDIAISFHFIGKKWSQAPTLKCLTSTLERDHTLQSLEFHMRREIVAIYPKIIARWNEKF